MYRYEYYHKLNEPVIEAFGKTISVSLAVTVPVPVVGLSKPLPNCRSQTSDFPPRKSPDHAFRTSNLVGGWLFTGETF